MSPEHQHSASKDLNHCMQKTRKHFCFPTVGTPRQGRKKKRIKICVRKWQWKMYSPSGSKRFQLKRNWAYSGGGLVVCRIVYTEALRPFCALYRCRLLSHVTRDWPEFFESVQAFSLVATHTKVFSAVMDRSFSGNVIDFSSTPPPALFQFLKIGSWALTGGH